MAANLAQESAPQIQFWELDIGEEFFFVEGLIRVKWVKTSCKTAKPAGSHEKTRRDKVGPDAWVRRA